MNGPDRVLVMPITMMFAGGGCEVQRETPVENLRALTASCRSR